MKLINIVICFLILSTQCIAQTWSTVGSGIYGGYVNSIYANDSMLYAGGTFIGPGSHIAQWDGSKWSDLSSGINGTVYSMYMYKNNLYVGGDFSSAGGNSAGGFAKWNGLSWSGMDTGFQHLVITMDTFSDLLIYDDGFKGVYSWNGKLLQGVMSFVQAQINSVVEYRGDLYAVGYLEVNTGIGTYAFEGVLYRIKKSGASYTHSLIGTFRSSSYFADLYSLAVHDSNLYIAGTFDTVNGHVMHNIAVYNGSNFSPVGGSINGTVKALAEYNGQLYAGGYFDSAGSIQVNNIACWNDTTWSALGKGVNNEVYSMATFKGDLYVGGGFTSPGNYIAKFNSTRIPDTLPVFNSVTLYPNPNSGLFTIGIPISMIRSTFKVYTVLGQEIGSYSLSTTLTHINIQGITFGEYVYKIEATNRKQVKGGKFLIH